LITAFSGGGKITSSTPTSTFKKENYSCWVCASVNVISSWATIEADCLRIRHKDLLIDCGLAAHQRNNKSKQNNTLHNSYLIIISNIHILNFIYIAFDASLIFSRKWRGNIPKSYRKFAIYPKEVDATLKALTWLILLMEYLLSL
jgi:hypothetical protein